MLEATTTLSLLAFGRTSAPALEREDLYGQHHDHLPLSHMEPFHTCLLFCI